MSYLSKTIRWIVAGLGIVLVAFAAGRGQAGEQTAASVVVNPYADVNWEQFQHHRAALHTHTLQSDGRHRVEEVIAAYREAGFTILAITDHDTAEPNVHVKRGSVPEEQATPYPRDPKPENYPANTTWPWTAFGGPAPEAVGMVGIEGNELSYRHHINSLFNSFGDMDGKRNEDELLLDVKRHGGLAFLCHPGIDAKWWTRQPVEWYAERFEQHDAAYLVGIEVTNCSVPTEKYDEGLWDQLLARFMPERPIWGIGADDMHALDSVRESDSVFLLAEACPEAVRTALEKGQFYLRKSTRRDDFRKRRLADELFPRIEAIRVDDQAGTITMRASNYDAIHWISAPESLEPVADYKTSHEPWPLGRVVHKGATINYRDTPHIKNYLRVELLRQDGEDLFRTFTNPFGLARTE